jgi:carboxypeptidase Taq
VADLASQSAVARDAWFKAKMARKWKTFEPELRKMINLSVKRAEATMEARGVSTVYDAMIDDADRGLSQKQVADLLSDLRDSLVPLVKKYSAESEKVDSSFLHRKLPLELQRELIKDSTSLIGYDSTSKDAWGAIDHTEHPFTNGYFDDVRITVHYTDDEFFDPFFGGMHEAGHALYEHNINHDWMHQPVGQAVSGGMHEAMSRFAENMIGRSRPFWNYYYPRLNSLAKGVFSDVSPDEFLRAINKVEPSKIRVKADEVTYSLHIVIRSEIERDLFAGKIEVRELPNVWNELYDKYLGIEIEHDAEGVLQDIHWSIGLYGIFQSYALGNIYDGMFVKALDKQANGWTSQIEKLKKKIQHWGSMYDIDVLVRKATGSTMTAEPFVQYLKKRYADLYG